MTGTKDMKKAAIAVAALESAQNEITSLIEEVAGDSVGTVRSRVHTIRNLLLEVERLTQA